jgi:hypothetical protein
MGAARAHPSRGQQSPPTIVVVASYQGCRSDLFHTPAKIAGASRGRSLFDPTQKQARRKGFAPRKAMPADGTTAAFWPPGDIGSPGSGSEGTIHRLRFAPEVRNCGFYQLSKIMLLQPQRDDELKTIYLEFSFSCLRRWCDSADMYQEVRQPGINSSAGLLCESRGGGDQNHDCLNQEPDRRHNEAGFRTR